MTDAEIKAIADRVIGPILSRLGLDHIEVHVESDDPESRPELTIEAFMKSGVPRVGGRVVSEAHGELSQSLLSAGETRFPYFRVRYPDGEAAVEEAR